MRIHNILAEATHLFDSIYDDVVPKFDQWKAEGKTIYIYSSGSVPAQKLLVKYSTKGDLSSVSLKKTSSSHIVNSL
jgi:methionine salvage enolase-phosphatase E1